MIAAGAGRRATSPRHSRPVPRRLSSLDRARTARAPRRAEGRAEGDGWPIRTPSRSSPCVIVQDAVTNRVLMLAYADDEALRRTRETGEAWFWSRCATSSGTRARPPATRWRWRRSPTTATATRCSTACARTAPPATRARSRASRRGSGASSPSAPRHVRRARTSPACSMAARGGRAQGGRGRRRGSARRGHRVRRAARRRARRPLVPHVRALAARGCAPSAVEDELRRHATRAGSGG